LARSALLAMTAGSAATPAGKIRNRGKFPGGGGVKGGKM
jgi:hypothetical protein